MYTWWRKHCILPLELSALAYFRICMGLLSLYNVIEVWYYHEEWLLDSGYLPRIDVMMSARHDLLDKNAFNTIHMVLYKGHHQEIFHGVD